MVVFVTNRREKNRKTREMMQSWKEIMLPEDSQYIQSRSSGIDPHMYQQEKPQ
jgi:hypothetical protein